MELCSVHYVEFGTNECRVSCNRYLCFCRDFEINHIYER